MTVPYDYPVMVFETPAAWAGWLEAHHADHGGIAMKLAKKGKGGVSVSHAEALDIALAYGWIDGQTGSIDDIWFTHRFGPRKARSKWSQINCAKAEALIAEGRMKPSGLAEVERAKADGRWAAAYEAQSKAVIPEDLQAALDASPKAAAFFATLSSQNRYAILHRTHDAKRPQTRAARIAKFVAMLERGETLH